jgi:acylphosphatase
MTDELIRRRLLIAGRVQGVFFRDSTHQQARSTGVAGHVRNLDDGRVEVVLEGEPQAVEQMVDFCRKGPDRAEVREVSVSEEEPEGVSSFEVV